MALDLYLPPGLAAGERRPCVVARPRRPHPRGGVAEDQGVRDLHLLRPADRGFRVRGRGNQSPLRGVPELDAAMANVEAALGFLRDGAEGSLSIRTGWPSGPSRAAAPSSGRCWPRARHGCAVVVGLLHDPRPAAPARPHPRRAAGGGPRTVLSRRPPFPSRTTQGPPLLVARAGLDQPWLNATVDAFVARALAANATLDVLNHPTGRHAFDVLDDDDRSREILARTLDFVRAHA